MHAAILHSDVTLLVGEQRSTQCSPWCGASLQLLCTLHANLAVRSHEQTVAADMRLAESGQEDTVVLCVQGMMWSRRFGLPTETVLAVQMFRLSRSLLT